MKFCPAATLLEIWRDGLRPDPPLSVSGWADRHYHIAKGAEPGPWRTDRVPYMREIMDRLSTVDPCTRVTLVKGSQLGGSEFLIIGAGYYAAQVPASVLMVQPTERAGENFSRERIAPAIDASPVLRETFADPRARDGDNTLMMKGYAGGFLAVCGSNSPANLASRPIRVVLFDEIDRFEASAGTEGDPIGLAEKRTNTFGRRKKIALNSSPSGPREWSRVFRSYDESDQRQYWCPCPHCQTTMLLTWDPLNPDLFARMEWDTLEDGALDRESVHMVCRECGGVVENRHKAWMLPRGEWLPTWQEDGEWVTGEPEGCDHYGYWITGTYAPVGWRSWADIVDEWLHVRDQPERRRQFVETLGLPYDDKGDAIDVVGLERRKERYAHPAPEGVVVLTAGCDVQADRLEVKVKGWGLGLESWLIDYRVIAGDPELPLVWETLDEILLSRYATADGSLPIEAACIDSGYIAQTVYAFCRSRWNRRVWAVKGKSGERDIWPMHWSSMQTRSVTGKLRQAAGKLKVVGVDKAKDHLWDRLHKEDPGPGTLHWPTHLPSGDELPAWYFRQLTSEVRKPTTRNGRKAWRWELPTGVRNEALDVEVYNYAAIIGWMASGRSLERAAESMDARVVSAPVQRGKRVRRGGGERRRLPRRRLRE